MKKLLSILLVISMIGSVSAIDCQEDEVDVDKVDSGEQECIPQPPSPMNDLQDFWVEEALDSIAEEMSNYFSNYSVSLP